MVPLSYKLQSGDIVEVMTSKRERGPSRDWLALVKTTRARNKIKAWFKAESRKDTEHAGRELLQEHLRRQGLPAQKVVGLAAARPRHPRDGIPQGRRLLHRAGRREDLAQGRHPEGAFSASSRATRRPASRPRPTSSRPDATAAAPSPPRRAYGIQVKGIDDVMLRLAKCCRPVPGDPIVGYISLGRGITIHREDCPNAEALRKDPERFTEVSWDGEGKTTFKVEIHVDAWDRHRLLEDLSRSFAETGINILEARCIVSDQMVRNRFVLEVGDTQAIDGAISRLRNIDAVFDAYRVTPGGG